MLEKLTVKILSFLNIRKNETHKLLLLFYLHILLGMVMVISYSISSSFFNIYVGAASLPWMFLALGIGKLPLSCFLSYLMSRSKIFISARAAVIITIILFFINGLLLKYSDNGLTEYSRIIAGFVYISTFLSVGVLSNFNWIIASEIFTTQQSKRLLSYITGSIYIGSIIGGIALSNSVKLVGSAFLIFFCILFLIQMLLALKAIYKNYLKIYLNEDSSGDATMSETLKYFSGNQYIVFLLAFFIIFEALRYFFFIKFNIAAEANFINDERGLTQYFGYYETIAAFCSIIITFFVINKFINYFGVWKTMIFIPFGYMLTFLLMYLSHMNIYFVTLIAVINEIIYYVVMPPVFSLVHKPIDTKMRSSIMSIINFFSASAGEILSFGIGLLITWNIFDFSQFSLLALIVALIALITAFLYRKNYLKILTQAIASKSGDISDDSDALFSDFQSAAHLEQFKKLLESQDSEVVILALQFIKNIKSENIVQIIKPLLNSQSSDIRAESLTALINIKSSIDIDTQHKIFEMLGDASFRVKTRALKILVAVKYQPALDAADDLIAGMLDSPSIERQILALETLAELKLVKFKDKTLALLAEGDNSLKKAAINTIPSLFEKGDASIITVLIEFLKYPDSELRESALNALEQLMGDKIEMISKFIADSNILLWSNIMELLARLDSRENYDYMNSALLVHIRIIYENMISINELKKIPFTDAVEPLINKLQSNNQLIIKTAFRILSIKRGRDLIDTIAKQLFNTDKNIRMNAIEALETAGDPNIVKVLMPVFEFETDAEIIEAGRKIMKLEPVKYQKILVDLLYDSDTWIGACSAYIIGELSQESFEPALKKYIEDIKNNSDYKNNEKRYSLIIENIKIALKNIDTLRRLLLEDDFMMPEKTDTLPIMERIIFLKKMPLFAKIDAENLMNIANILEEKSYDKETVIIKHGTNAENFFIIINGSVKKIMTGSKDENLLKSYDYFGEFILLDDCLYPYSIITETQTKVFVINKRDFTMILKKYSEITIEMLKQMSQKFL